MSLTGRNMFIWKLRPVLDAEMGVASFVRKAKRAKLSSVWIKVAVGASPYLRNVEDADFVAVRERLAGKGISVWGWHEPRCATLDAAEREAERIATLADDLKLDGILMDAEKPEGDLFFQGTVAEASRYAERARARLDALGKGLGLCSHDVPHNFPGFPFAAFAEFAHVNVPQVYYGGSSSVENRLERAIDANSMVSLPFVPVGSGWIGGGGGNPSASATAERAIVFMRLVREHGFPAYSFWHWEGAPSKLWQVLFDEPV